MALIEYQKNDIVRLTVSKFEELKELLWFTDNTFTITNVGGDGLVYLKELEEPVSAEELQRVPINKTKAGNIYYDPVIAASVIGPDGAIPVYSTDYTYFMDAFKRVKEEDGSTLFEHVDRHGFKYVDELQHWLREYYGSDDLKIFHKIITPVEVQYRNIWKLRDNLLEAGVSSYQFLYEMANLLYLRWRTFFNEAELLRWKELERASGDDLLNKYQKAIYRINQQTRIYLASSLERAISEVSKCAKEENIAELFDLMLQENIKSKDGGSLQNYTPNVLGQLLVEMMQPKTGERWYDPAAGFAGFLVEIDRYLKKKNDNYQQLSKKEKAFQLTEAISGMEIQKEVAWIGLCNTRFHGLWCDVSCGDSLERVKYQQYEGIICEPPMPVFSLTEKSKDGKVKRNRQTEFVNLILNSLSPNNESRAALLLPESFFWVSTADYHNMRRRLFEDHDVYAILRLPKGIYNGFSISMCALFLYRNKNNGKKVLVYDMQSDKLDLETVNTCADNIFNGFKKAFWNGKLDKKSSFLSLNEIKDEGYRVSFQTGGAKEQKSVEDPSHYLAEANKIVKDIRILLSKIERELND